jgi:PAS domain S-box-containing protein
VGQRSAGEGTTGILWTRADHQAASANPRAGFGEQIVYARTLYWGCIPRAGNMVVLAVSILVLAGAAALAFLRVKKRAVAAEAERERARNWYRAMAEESSDIIVLREDGRIVLASNAMGRILGRTPDEFNDGGYLRLVHPDDLGEAMKLRGRPPPGEIWSATYRLPHADGHYIWFEARTRGAYDAASGAFLREITVLRDITGRKAQELKMAAALERAEAASKAKSLFLATVSHELRTPLNAIMGFSELLKEERLAPVGSARRRDYLESIHDSGAHLLGLINDILDVSKLGALELELEPVELEPLVAECTQSIACQAEKSGLRVYTRLEAGACVLQADRKRLRQMLLNLLSNAMKFTPQGGEVCVSTSRCDGAVALAVSDTGIGMEEDAIPKAFERFGQLDDSLARKYEGAGLGLPLTRQLAELHGWNLTIDSRKNAGTTVMILFSNVRALADVA